MSAVDKERVTFEVVGWVTDSGTTQYSIYRKVEPVIIDSAGRRQWVKEGRATTRTALVRDLTVAECGQLLAELASTMQYHLTEGQ